MLLATTTIALFTLAKIDGATALTEEALALDN
jgi:hypothetical protein